MTFELPNWARSLLTVLLVPVLSLAAPQVFAADEEEVEVTEEVVVTGSRVKRSDFTSASPITVITGQSILESGFSNLGEALRSQAVAGTAGFNQSSVLSGGGSTSIDLRNLGQSRVLVLINGKRVASFADALANQAVDLQFLPNSMIDRVDILRDGASAIYGSDAISGVVNVILKERFEGIEAGVSSGISGEGDGEQYTANFVMGTTSDRGSLMLGGEYSYQNNVNQTDRDWAFPAISGLGPNGATNGSFFSPGGVYFGANGLFCTQPKAFGGDEITDVFPNCPSFFSNQNVGSPGDVQLLRYDYALNQDLYNQNEVYTMAGYGVYELFEGAEAFLEVQYAKRQGESNLDGNPGSVSTPAFPNGSFVPATNPNIGGLGAGNFFFRPSSTIGTRVSNQESDTIRIVGGVRGDIVTDNFFDGWSYEVSYLYTRVDADLRTNSVWNLARFNRIVDPNACALDPLCVQAVNPSGALDVLRPGNWTQSEIAYMRQNTLATSEFQTTGWFGMMTGPIMELPAGEVQVAFGYETRKDTGFAKPDSVTEAGESVANQTFTSEGDFNVDEFFAEVDIPILADVPFFEQLDLNVQGRYSDYDTFGSETVYRAGLNWQIVPDIRIRATMSTAYRSPQVTDLFGGGTASFDFFTHPCVGVNADPVVQANCAAAGIPNTANQLSAQFAVLSGSNPNLDPETADTSTIGLIFTPTFIDGLSISIDYWDIEVEDLISRLTSDSVNDACWASAGLTAPECAQFTTAYNAATNNLTIRDGVNQLTNLDDVSTDGFDMAANYEFDIGDVVMNIDFQGTYVKENTFYPGAGGADDRGSIPRIRGNFNIGADWQSWDFNLRVRYIHGMNDPRFTGDDNVFGYDDVESHTEFDVRASYNWDKYRVTVGVNDVTDEDPPYVFSSGNNSDLFLYGAMGRYFFMRASASL